MADMVWASAQILPLTPAFLLSSWDSDPADISHGKVTETEKSSSSFPAKSPGGQGVIQHDLPSLVMSEKSKQRKEAKGNLKV